MNRLLPLHKTLRDDFQKLAPVYDSEDQLHIDQDQQASAPTDER